MEQTYIMAKPDAVARGLVGTIVTRFTDVRMLWSTSRRWEEARAFPALLGVPRRTCRGRQAARVLALHPRSTRKR